MERIFINKVLDMHNEVEKLLSEEERLKLYNNEVHIAIDSEKICDGDEDNLTCDTSVVVIGNTSINHVINVICTLMDYCGILSDDLIMHKEIQENESEDK